MSGVSNSDTIDLKPWIDRIKARRQAVRDEIAPREVRVLMLASRVFSAPRRLLKWLRGTNEQHSEMQLPWIPEFVGLASQPFHDTSKFRWVRALEEAVDDIRAELQQVQRDFGRAAYDSDRNVKVWKTFYFYLNGRPVAEHLDACPKTKAVLALIPVNGLHVCFSAIEPGGKLQPHTGPTNASLTAHLGLKGCEGSAIWVAGERRPYVEGKVLIFDDSFVHWVEHKGDKLRYTLMVTFWHPEMNLLERKLMATVFKKTPDDVFGHKPNPVDRQKA
jgi:hypothetical protein